MNHRFDYSRFVPLHEQYHSASPRDNSSRWSRCICHTREEHPSSKCPHKTPSKEHMCGCRTHLQHLDSSDRYTYHHWHTKAHQRRPFCHASSYQSKHYHFPSDVCQCHALNHYSTSLRTNHLHDRSCSRVHAQCFGRILRGI